MQRKKMLIAGLAIALLIGVASAALISYFGQVKMTAIVKQAVLLDGKDVTEMPTIEETAKVAGGQSFCRYHWLQSQTSVPVTVLFETAYDPGLWDNEITTTYTTTITESSSYDDYVIDSQRLVGLYVGLTLNDLLAKDLEYTVDVTSNPKFAPNINIWITSGGTTYVLQAWGKDWTGTGPHRVTFSDLVSLVAGYGATVNPSLGGANTINGGHAKSYGSPPYYYYDNLDDLKLDWGTWKATFVEVRAQAGAAGGQVLRPVEFKAAGITIEVPDSDTFTTVTLQPGEFLPFYICYKFDLLIKADTYYIYSTVKPAS
jgi:hypothetical protein